jgi:hypothetical protein
LDVVQERYANSNLLLPRLAAGANGVDEEVDYPILEQFVAAPLPRPAGLPLVDDWECLRVMPTPLPCLSKAPFPTPVPPVQDCGFLFLG